MADFNTQIADIKNSQRQEPIFRGVPAYRICFRNFSQSTAGDSIKIILSVSLDSNTEIDTLKNELLRVLNEWKEDYKVNIFRFSSKGKPFSNAEFQKYAIDLTVKPTN